MMNQNWVGAILSSMWLAAIFNKIKHFQIRIKQIVCPMFRYWLKQRSKGQNSQANGKRSMIKQTMKQALIPMIPNQNWTLLLKTILIRQSISQNKPDRYIRYICCDASSHMANYTFCLILMIYQTKKIAWLPMPTWLEKVDFVRPLYVWWSFYIKKLQP